VEATHFKIVERCIKQLTMASLENDGEKAIDDSPMTLDDTGECPSGSERVFLRSLNILDQFVKGFKARSQYNQGVQAPAQVHAVDVITGLPLTIKMRWHGLNYQSPVSCSSRSN
jgi:hypothetical protein